MSVDFSSTVRTFSETCWTFSGVDNCAGIDPLPIPRKHQRVDTGGPIAKVPSRFPLAEPQEPSAEPAAEIESPAPPEYRPPEREYRLEAERFAEQARLKERQDADDLKAIETFLAAEREAIETMVNEIAPEIAKEAKRRPH